MKQHSHHLKWLLVILLWVVGTQVSKAYNTTNYKITVKNNSHTSVHMKLGKGVGTDSGECIHNITSKLDDVKLDSGASYEFELAFKGGDQFYLPDGSGGSFGVPLGCLRGDKKNETKIHFDFVRADNSEVFAYVLLQDYTDSGDLMRCSAVTKDLGFTLLVPGALVMGCSANRGSDSHQAVTIYVNNLPNEKKAKEGSQ